MTQPHVNLIIVKVLSNVRAKKVLDSFGHSLSLPKEIIKKYAQVRAICTESFTRFDNRK